jgi:hypothetical protein
MRELHQEEQSMKAITDVLATADAPRSERLTAQRVFLQERPQLWRDIHEGNFPNFYFSTNNRKYVGAPRRTAIRCDFLMACKIALGPKYAKDRIADLAQRDLLFYVLRDREVFPHRTGKKFYCCPKCTSKLHECVTAKVFRYIDNSKWKKEIELQGAAE